MLRAEIEEFHYITSLENLPSILNVGILSHNKASQIAHSSVACEDVQLLRAIKCVPGGLELHDYVNLYFHARNPMMYKDLREYGIPAADLCVLRISGEILDLSDVVITDRNAAVTGVAFYAVEEGLRRLKKAEVYARSWTHSDQLEYRRRKAIRCAEVLIPHCLPSGHIFGAHVSCAQNVPTVKALCSRLDVVISPDLFFLE